MKERLSYLPAIFLDTVGLSPLFEQTSLNQESKPKNIAAACAVQFFAPSYAKLLRKQERSKLGIGPEPRQNEKNQSIIVDGVMNSVGLLSSAFNPYLFLQGRAVVNGFYSIASRLSEKRHEYSFNSGAKFQKEHINSTIPETNGYPKLSQIALDAFGLSPVIESNKSPISKAINSVKQFVAPAYMKYRRQKENYENGIGPDTRPGQLSRAIAFDAITNAIEVAGLLTIGSPVGFVTDRIIINTLFSAYSRFSEKRHEQSYISGRKSSYL